MSEIEYAEVQDTKPEVQDLKPKPKKIAFIVVRIIFINIVLQMVIYLSAKTKLSNMTSLLLSAIPSALEFIYTFYKYGRMEIVCLITILGIIISVIIAAYTDDPKLLLIKDSSIFLLYGILFFGSILCFRENLIFHYRRRFAAFTNETQEELDGLWHEDNVKYSTTFMCMVWGSGFILEAVIRVILIYCVPISSMTQVTAILAALIILCLGLWNIGYSKRLKALSVDEAPVTPREQPSEVSIV